MHMHSTSYDMGSKRVLHTLSHLMDAAARGILRIVLEEPMNRLSKVGTGQTGTYPNGYLVFLSPAVLGTV